MELILSPVDKKAFGSGDVCMYQISFPIEAISNAQLSVEVAKIAKDHKVFVGVGTNMDTNIDSLKAA